VSFLDEVAAYLVAQNVGVLGTNIFLGSRAVIPTGSGPFLSLIETGGTEATRVHNIAGPSTQRPTAQLLVRAGSYQAARTMSKAAYTVLNGVWNTTLSGTFYQKITARQEPTDIGLDGSGRVMVVFNIDAQKQPS
jgi:minor capsid protein